MQLLIELPPRAEQIAFNRKRWAEILDDHSLAGFPGKIESNAFGTVLMGPPASGDHSRLTRVVQRELESRLGGLALPECPVSTIDGVRAADVGWPRKSAWRFSLRETPRPRCARSGTSISRLVPRKSGCADSTGCCAFSPRAGRWPNLWSAPDFPGGFETSRMAESVD